MSNYFNYCWMAGTEMEKDEPLSCSSASHYAWAKFWGSMQKIDSCGNSNAQKYIFYDAFAPYCSLCCPRRHLCSTASSHTDGREYFSSLFTLLLCLNISAITLFSPSSSLLSSLSFGHTILFIQPCIILQLCWKKPQPLCSLLLSWWQW